MLLVALACIAGLRLTAGQLLPALSMTFILAGLALAAGSYAFGIFGGRQSAAWMEIAAMIVFLGFAGAMLSDHGDALALLGIDAGKLSSVAAN
jgi:hypothetical protein